MVVPAEPDTLVAALSSFISKEQETERARQRERERSMFAPLIYEVSYYRFCSRALWKRTGLFFFFFFFSRRLRSLWLTLFQKDNDNYMMDLNYA